jgi:hypothetical protein
VLAFKEISKGRMKVKYSSPPQGAGSRPQPVGPVRDRVPALVSVRPVSATATPPPRSAGQQLDFAQLLLGDQLDRVEVVLLAAEQVPEHGHHLAGGGDNRDPVPTAAADSAAGCGSPTRLAASPACRPAWPGSSGRRAGGLGPARERGAGRVPTNASSARTPAPQPPACGSPPSNASTRGGSAGEGGWHRATSKPVGTRRSGSATWWPCACGQRPRRSRRHARSRAADRRRASRPALPATGSAAGSRARRTARRRGAGRSPCPCWRSPP